MFPTPYNIIIFLFFRSDVLQHYDKIKVQIPLF